MRLAFPEECGVVDDTDVDTAGLDWGQVRSTAYVIQQRITYHPDFDGFPMFSSDGRRLVWASNRNGKVPHETNIFIADWVE